MKFESQWIAIQNFVLFQKEKLTQKVVLATVAKITDLAELRSPAAMTETNPPLP